MRQKSIKQLPSNKHLLLTKEGLDELRAKLDNLRKVRYELCNDLRNIEPNERTDHIMSTDAVKMLEINEAEVSKIADVLSNAQAITKDEHPSDVKIGSTVNLRFGDHTVEYTLVHPIEADPSAHKISEKSPLGSALIGKKPHEHISFVAPKGIVYNYQLDYIA